MRTDKKHPQSKISPIGQLAEVQLKKIIGFPPLGEDHHGQERPIVTHSIQNSVHHVPGVTDTQNKATRKTKLKKSAPLQMAAGEMGPLYQDVKPKWTQRGDGVYTESESDSEDLNEREKMQSTEAGSVPSRVVESGEKTCQSSAKQFHPDVAIRVEDEVAQAQSNFAELRVHHRNTRHMPMSNVDRRFDAVVPSPMTAGVMGQLDKARNRDAVYTDSESEDGKEIQGKEDIDEVKINKGIAIIREAIETKVRADSELQILKLKQRIAELEDKVRFLESIPKPSSGEEVMVGAAQQVYPNAPGSQTDTLLIAS